MSYAYDSLHKHAMYTIQPARVSGCWSRVMRSNRVCMPDVCMAMNTCAIALWFMLLGRLSFVDDRLLYVHDREYD